MTKVDTTRSVADRLAELVAGVTGGELPIRLRAWDGSESGPASGPVLVLHNRRAVRRVIFSPGAGAAEAYVAGELDVEGDLAAALSALWKAETTGARPRIAMTQWRQLLSAGRLGILSRRPPTPGSRASLSGRLHPHSADQTAIAAHQELPNKFYELLLDPSMTYSCGYFADGPSGGLAAAQQSALDLICSRLDLGPGKRHLDVGCGWGSLICYAAEHFGTHSTGVTRSRRQFEYVSKRVADSGLADRVQVRLADYRRGSSSADDGQFDAVSAVETGEYVPDAQYPVFAGLLHSVLRPGGRALVQQRSPGEIAPAGLLGTCLAPGMRLRPVATAASLLGAAGLEVCDTKPLGQHYGWTMRAWAETLERSWNGAVDVIGEADTRAWQLCLVGGAVAFAENRMSADQILAVRPPAPRSTQP